MKTIKGKNNVLKIWLKRIFSVTTISVIISIVALYYTIKTYVVSLPEHPPQITIRFPVFDWEEYTFIYEERSQVTDYWILSIYDCPLISENAAFCGPKNTISLPCICNETSESLKDFTFRVRVYFDDIAEKYVNYEVNDLAFEILEKDANSIYFRYKNDVLPPHTSLPNPILLYDFVEISDSRKYDIMENAGCYVRYEYEITYEGADRYIKIDLYHKMYYIDDATEDYVNQKTSKFLKENVFVLGDRRIKYEENDVWAIVANGSFYDNIRHLSKDDFAKLNFTDIDDLQQK